MAEPTIVTNLNESRVPQILIGNIVPQAFATAFVLARMYSRGIIIRSWGPDDSALLVAWVSSVCLTILNCLGARFGNGKHFATVPPENLKPLLQIAYATLVVYNIALGMTKLSICLFYLRIFPDIKYRRLIYATIGFILLYTIPIEFIAIFQCKPVEAVWEISERFRAKCLDTFPVFYTSTVCHVMTDIWLIAFMVPTIMGLHMGSRSRAALLLVVMMGWLVVAAALVRNIRISLIARDPDRTWVSYDTTIWTAVEVTVGIFCVSAPAIKPLLTKLAPGLLNTTKPSYLSSESWPHRKAQLRPRRDSNGFQMLPKCVTDGTTISDDIWGRNIAGMTDENFSNVSPTERT